MRRARLGWPLALALATSTGVSAQSKPVDFLTAVPETPASSYLGLSPTNVQRPGNLRDFGAAVLNGVGADGKARQGIALDASIWNLIPGYDLPLAKYARNRLAYAVGNLQASAATTKSAGSGSDLLASLGLKTVLLDRADPLLDPRITSRLGAALQRCAPDQPGAVGQSLACVDSVTEEIIGGYTSSRWNAAQLAVAAAWGSRLQGASVTHARYDGLSLWGLGAFPLGTRMQVIAQAAYKDRSAADTVPRYQGFDLGARVVLGSATFNGFVEYGREWRNPEDGAPQLLALDKNIGGWSGGFEFRAMPNTWLSAGAGTRFDALGKSERSAVFAGIKWGVTSKSRIEKLRQ